MKAFKGGEEDHQQAMPSPSPQSPASRPSFAGLQDASFLGTIGAVIAAAVMSTWTVSGNIIALSVQLAEFKGSMTEFTVTTTATLQQQTAQLQEQTGQLQQNSAQLQQLSTQLQQQSMQLQQQSAQLQQQTAQLQQLLELAQKKR
ncbi:hypothetical protein ABPG75_002869 [Micractinium tetrahymenae]